MSDTIPQTLSDTLKRSFHTLMSSVHTTMPGSIEKYDGKRIASVKPNVQRRLADGTYLELPVIEEVPVLFLGSSDFSFTYPLKKGDPVMIHFCERSIEEWLQSGTESKPEDLRRFSLTDAIAVPGLYNDKAKFPESNNKDVDIIYKNATIKLKPDGTINLNGETFSVAMFEQLNTALQAFVVKYNTDMVAIAAGASAAISASGLWLSPLAVGGATLDISGSQSQTVKVGS